MILTLERYFLEISAYYLLDITAAIENTDNTDALRIIIYKKIYDVIINRQIVHTDRSPRFPINVGMTFRECIEFTDS